jgi:predicted Rossmann fold nucleotide-binding protein DprA/Smf involved in DNA uptake
MKRLQNQLKSVSKSLVSLSKQVEKISDQVAKAAPPKPAARKTSARKKAAPKKRVATARKTAAAKRAPAKAAAGKSSTVLDSVFNAVKRSKKGASISQLRKKTGLEARQLSNALYKLTKKGKIQAVSRGIYAKK